MGLPPRHSDSDDDDDDDDDWGDSSNSDTEASGEKPEALSKPVMAEKPAMPTKPAASVAPKAPNASSSLAKKPATVCAVSRAFFARCVCEACICPKRLYAVRVVCAWLLRAARMGGRSVTIRDITSVVLALVDGVATAAFRFRRR